MAVGQRDFEIIQGATFNPVIRWGSGEIAFKAISGITKAAPAVVTCPTHDLVDNWPVSFTGVVGMKEVNAKTDPPGADDIKHVAIIDPNTVAIKRLSTALFSTYTSGGYLRYNVPVDLTGFTARMYFRKNKKDAVPLMTLDTDGGITINNTTKRIEIFISAVDTAAIVWKRAFYDLEMVAGALTDAGAIVNRILEGVITVSKEATY
jgi:Ubiquitin-activating enzyme E1 FCCH domain